MKKFRYFILALVCCVGFLSVGSMRVYAFESEDNFYPIDVSGVAVEAKDINEEYPYSNNNLSISTDNKYYLNNDVLYDIEWIQWRDISGQDFTFPYNPEVYDYYLLGTLVAACIDDTLSTFKPREIFAAYYDVNTSSTMVYRKSDLNIYNIDKNHSRGFGFSFRIDFESANNTGIRSIFMYDDKDGSGNKPANLTMEFGIMAVPIGTDEVSLNQQILNKLSEMETSITGSIDANTSAINSLGERITSTLSDFFTPYFDNITDAFKKALPDTQDSQNEVLSGAMDDYQAAEQVVFSPAMDSLTEFDFESHNISSLGTGFVAAITFVSSCMTNMYDLTPFSFVFGVIATLGLASICIGLSRLWFGKKGK